MSHLEMYTKNSLDESSLIAVAEEEPVAPPPEWEEASAVPAPLPQIPVPEQDEPAEDAQTEDRTTPNLGIGGTWSQPSAFQGQWTENDTGEEGNGNTGFEGREQSTPDTFDGAGTFNILKNYRWTLSRANVIPEIPGVRLKEHRINQNMLQRQSAVYVGGTVESLAGGSGTRGLLDVYNEIWPDNPTGNSYIFPFFNDVSFQLDTPQWSNVDSITESVAAAGSGASSALRAFNTKTGNSIANMIDGGAAIGGAALGGAQLGLKAMYPVVGIPDRPRIFTQHNDRTITISFPLYNTANPEDWKGHYNFLYVFASQNLFLKRNFITGAPPVFYRVYIPGQYYSHSSCVTQFKVTNLGNQRTQSTGNQNTIVPDAYQVDITLMEMVMPSLNQYQALINGEAESFVTVGNG